MDNKKKMLRRQYELEAGIDDLEDNEEEEVMK